MSEIAPVSSRVRANGLEHHVLTWGNAGGPPIVLAHGFLDHAWSFHFVAQHLAPRRRVLAFDWRGHGQTEWIGRGGYYHFPDYVLDLTELLPAIAGAEYDLVGHSMGGTACAMFAGTRPPGLRSLVLCEGLGPPAMPLEALADRLTSFVASVARARRPRSDAPVMRDLDDAAQRLRQQHGDLDETLARLLAQKGTREVPGGLEWRFDPLHRTTAPMPFRPEGLCSLLARIEPPVLVVSGTRGFRTEDHATRVAAIPRAREVDLDGVGHMMHWHAPDRLARAILEHTER